MNKLLIFLFILSTLILCQCTKDSELIITNGNCLPDVKDKYAYPIRPGMEEWKSLKSVEEIYQACQLPDNVLKSTSTLGLVRSFLDVPFSLNSQYIVSSASPLATWYNIYSKFNSIQEVINRNDAAKALVLYYDGISFKCLKSMTIENRMTFSAQITALEYLFTKQMIICQLNEMQKVELVALLLEKYKQLQKNSYDGMYVSGTLSAMAWIMYDMQYTPVVDYYNKVPPIGRLTEQGYVLAEDINSIVSFAESFTH